MDKNKLLKIATSNPILEVCRDTGTEPIELMKFYNNLENLLKKNILYGEIGDRLVFLLVFCGGKSGAEQLNIFRGNEFLSEIKSGLLDKGNIFYVNSDGTVTTRVESQFVRDLVQATEFSESKDIVFFIQYRTVYLLVKGKIRDFIYDILEYERRGVSTPKTLPGREYRKLIEYQYQDVVYKEKGVKYWWNKTNRILVDNPEIHLHKPLWSYLDSHVIDGKVDSGATVSGQDDRTDIRILTFDNALYIIEIKCLGTTKSGTYYSDDWANQGRIQINQYLEDEKGPTRGTLVLYDGRQENRDIVWCKGFVCNPKYDNDPMRFYLESESASVKAKRILSNLKKKSREQNS